MSVHALIHLPDAPRPCAATAAAAERRDAFRWGAVGDLLLAQRELGRRRLHAAEAMLRRAEAALIASWTEADVLAGDPTARDRAHSRAAGLIAAARAGIADPARVDPDTAQARLAEALGAVWALEDLAADRAA